MAKITCSSLGAVHSGNFDEFYTFVDNFMYLQNLLSNHERKDLNEQV